MKGATYGEYAPPEVSQVKELETPSPGRNDVLVKTRSAIVSFGDCRMRSMGLSDIRFFERLFSRLVLDIRRSQQPVLEGGVVAPKPSRLTCDESVLVFPRSSSALEPGITAV